MKEVGSATGATLKYGAGIYRRKPPDPEGAARGRGVVFHDKSMVTMVYVLYSYPAPD